MRTAKDIEAYLDRLGRTYADKGEHSTFVLNGPHGVHIALRVEPPLVVLRANVGKVPTGHENALFRRLLELNASELLHSSYGLVDSDIFLGSALALENLDLNELQVVLDEFDLALAQHTEALFDLAKKSN